MKERFLKAPAENFQKGLASVEISELGPKIEGKVRDIWDLGNRLIMVTTDRQSAFDAIICLVPGKGQILTELSCFGFETTSNILPNHFLAMVNPNTMLVKKATAFPIEMVVRSYLTGSSPTSIWVEYQQGRREFFGQRLPDGMRKNQPLPQPFLTPSTRGEKGGRDINLRNREEAYALVGRENFEKMSEFSFAIFERHQNLCQQVGLILESHKYEYGLIDSKISLIDEILTPDSSRFFIKDTFEERVSCGLEPENTDKEVLRLFLKSQGFDGEGQVPQVLPEIIEKLSGIYQECCQRILGRPFLFANFTADQIRQSILDWFGKPH